MNTGNRISVYPLVLFLLIWTAGNCRTAEPQYAHSHSRPAADDLSELSLEQLMDIEVVTVSRKEQRQFTVASAIHVLTGDDIRRSGAQSIPEALRLVPGMQVARINANQWAVTCRGFNEYFANKLLVMIDGRSIYSQIFSGVMWEENDLLFEDLDRIEVVRGPGATSWGANAVNGVINIISKNSRATQGWLISSGLGNELHNQTALRYGGKIGDSATFRIWGKYLNYDDLRFEDGNELPDSGDAHDGWESSRWGFRADWGRGNNRFCLQSDAYVNRYDTQLRRYNFATDAYETDKDDNQSYGGNILGRWIHDFSPSSQLTLQAYYDRIRKISFFAPIRVDNYDLDMQHKFRLGSRNEIVWGLGFHFTADSIDSAPEFSFSPEKRDEALYTGFIQDEIELVQEKLNLTLGTKMEHNYHTGFEIQPGARLAWTPTEKITLWSAVTRAVRTPSRTVDDSTVNAFLPASIMGTGFSTGKIEIHGDNRAVSEVEHAYEFGLRVAPRKNIYMDVATFWSHYSHLRYITREFRGVKTDRTVSPPAISFLEQNSFSNPAYGHTYGAEFSFGWDVTEKWRLLGGYSYFRINLKDHDTDGDPYNYQYGEGPRNHAYLVSHLDLPAHIELDLIGRYVDADTLPSRRIPAYADMDVHVGWKPDEHVEFSLIGRNLFDDHKLEFIGEAQHEPFPAENERSIFAKMILRF